MPKVVFFGTSEFAVPILGKLAQSSWRPDLAVSTPDAPAGRGLDAKPPPVKIAAEKIGIPVIQPERLSPIPNSLTSPVDLFIVAAYGKILPPELLKIPKRGSLNIHPSFLPRWRGPSPIQHSILSGDDESGVTIILMDEKVDHGPVLKFKYLNIETRKWTTPELTSSLAEIGADLLIETIPEWLAGRITPQGQDDSKAIYCKMLKKEDGAIDWSWSAGAIERKIRAFSPWPGAYTFWHKFVKPIRLIIEQADSQEPTADSRDEAGTVLAVKGGLVVKAGQGLLAVKRLTLEGKPTMDAPEFLKGHSDIIGAVLG